jgi:hypothetical protein
LRRTRQSGYSTSFESSLPNAHLRSAIGNQATTEWLNAHTEWWSGKNKEDQRAVAGLAIEHLGALKTQRQSDSGRVEPAVQLTYATNSKMQEILENSWTEEMGTRLRSILTFHCAQSDTCFSFISVRESRESRESRASQGG